MPSRNRTWRPVYRITSAIARALMRIEAARAVVDSTPLSLAAQEKLRHLARIKSTHYSTQIEGNKLTLKEAEQVIGKKKASFHGRERDVREVRNYWDALLKVEEWASKRMEFTEDLIRHIHAVVEKGKRAKPTKYRDGQNVIRDSGDGRIVYLPPEPKDVPRLMKEMVGWVRRAHKEQLPPPLIAALIHYQFVTIHPYYDGNGRTARLLATFILQRDGYGLHGFFSMEEHHARDLQGYYRSLMVHRHHNYYAGRAQADLTRWLEYFTSLLAGVFTRTKEETLVSAKDNSVSIEPELLRALDHRARAILALFSRQDKITTAQAARSLGLSDRMTRLLLAKWVKAGWLSIVDRANRNRAFGLSAIYRQFVGNSRPNHF